MSLFCTHEVKVEEDDIHKMPLINVILVDTDNDDFISHEIGSVTWGFLSERTLVQ